MTAKSVIAIGQVLRLRAEEAGNQYQLTITNLRKKYNTTWLESRMNRQERELLCLHREMLREARELLTDFERQQW